MRGDIPQAAFRLLTDDRAMVRTHEGEYGDGSGNQGGERFAGRLSKPLVVGGKEYPSINAAIAFLHVSHKTITKMIDNGQAQYVVRT